MADEKQGSKMTLWEMLTRRDEHVAQTAKTPETKPTVFNPLGLAGGDLVLLDGDEFVSNRFKVAYTSDMEVTNAGMHIHQADYGLIDVHDAGEGPDGKKRILRIIPRTGIGAKPDIILLATDFEAGYDEGVFNALNAGTLPMEGADYAGFSRLGGLLSSFTAKVSQYAESESSSFDIRFWDFVRMDPAPMAIIFVEMDMNNGWFTLMRGRLQDGDKVHAIKKD